MALLNGKQIRDATLDLVKLNSGGAQGTVTFGTGTLIGVTDSPTLDTDLANKAYVDALAAGLDPKEAVLVATSADLSATYNASGGAGASGQFTSAPAVLDFVTLAEGDRVLVKDQTDAKQNGIYVVTSTTTTWDRATDMDGTPANEVSTGNSTHVSAGSNWQASGWVVGPDAGTNGILTLNVNNINWFQFSAASQFTFSNGLTQSGNEVKLGGSVTDGTTNLTGNNFNDISMTNFEGITIQDRNGSGISLDAGTNIMTFTDAGGNGVTVDDNNDRITLSTITGDSITINPTGGDRISLSSGAGQELLFNASSTDFKLEGGSGVGLFAGSVNTVNSAQIEMKGVSTNTRVAVSDGGGDGINLIVNNGDRIDLLQAGGMTITDSNTNGGIKYSADYSANYVNRSLVDKEYVDTQITSAETSVNNGIQDIGGSTYGLGGTLIQNTDIDANGFNFNATNIGGMNRTGTGFFDYETTNGIRHKADSFYINQSPSISITTTNHGGSAGLSATLDTIGLTTGNFVFNMSNVGAGSTTFTDNTGSPEGIKYSADYSATFVDRSLVDKAYVDSVVGSVGAQNGLTEFDGGTIGLGGTLDQNTTITGDSGTYTIDFNDMLSFGATADAGDSFLMGNGTFQLQNSNGDNIDLSTNITLQDSAGAEIQVSSGGITTQAASGNTNYVYNSESEGLELSDTNISLGMISSINQAPELTMSSSAVKTRIAEATGTNEIAIDLRSSGNSFITDDIQNRGIFYASDYGSNWIGASFDNVLVNKKYVDDEVAAVSGSLASAVTTDKNQTASITSSDGDTTGVTITSTPNLDAYVEVLVNGTQQVLGDGVKTTDCYFSVDSGTTARNIADITASDTLYWNGSIAGFELSGTDRIDLNYEA